MRILMVSTSYPRDASDWRGLFIRQLVDAMARIDALDLRLWAPPGEVAASVRSVTDAQESIWLSGLMQSGGISHLMRNGGIASLLAPLKLLRLLRAAYRRERDIDAYHINWLQSALPLPDNEVPALIAVLGNDLRLLRLPLMRTALRRVMKRRRVALCPNAEWMRTPLEAAFGDLAEITPVPFGIDARWFAIERLPPPLNPRWLAVTRLTADKLGPLFDWSEPLFATGMRELHLYGPMQEAIDVPHWVRYHGAADADTLAQAFSGATGLVTLSNHAEGRPQVMLEAMAAGLPIIAMRTRAHGDVVRDGVTGALCDSSGGYSRALELLEDVAANASIGAEARALARNYDTWDECANRYVQIHSRLQGNRA